MKRRHFLTLSVISISSGCAGLFPEEEPGNEDGTCAPPSTAPFVLWNDDDAEHTLTLTVRNGDEVLVDATRTLGPDGSREVASPIDETGTYRLSASIEEGGETSREWVVDCGDAEYVQAYVDEGASVELRVKRQTDAG